MCVCVCGSEGLQAEEEGHTERHVQVLPGDLGQPLQPVFKPLPWRLLSAPIKKRSEEQLVASRTVKNVAGVQSDCIFRIY